MDPAESEPVCSTPKEHGACLHWLEEQLAFVCREMLEAVISSESTYAILTEKLNLVIEVVQQASASPIGPTG